MEGDTLELKLGHMNLNRHMSHRDLHKAWADCHYSDVLVATETGRDCSSD